MGESSTWNRERPRPVPLSFDAVDVVLALFVEGLQIVDAATTAVELSPWIEVIPGAFGVRVVALRSVVSRALRLAQWPTRHWPAAGRGCVRLPLPPWKTSMQ